MSSPHYDQRNESYRNSNSAIIDEVRRTTAVALDEFEKNSAAGEQDLQSHALEIPNSSNAVAILTPKLEHKEGESKTHGSLNHSLGAQRVNYNSGFGKTKKIFTPRRDRRMQRERTPYVREKQLYQSNIPIDVSENMPPKPSSMAELAGYIQKSIQYNARKMDISIAFDSMNYNMGHAILTISTKLKRQFILEIKVNMDRMVTFDVYSIYDTRTKIYNAQHLWNDLCRSRNYIEINTLALFICNAFYKRLADIKMHNFSGAPNYHNNANSSGNDSRIIHHNSPEYPINDRFATSSPAYRSSSHRSPSPDRRSSSRRSSSRRSPSPERRSYDDRYMPAAAAGLHAGPQSQHTQSNSQISMGVIMQQMDSLQRKLNAVLAETRK